jgi:hypothetical protein
MTDINVSITDATQLVSEAGFGLPLIVGTAAAHAYEEYDISSNLTAVVADYADTTEVYKIAAAIAGQSPRPQKLAIFGLDISSSSTKPADVTAALNTLITTNNNWYRLLLEDKTEAVIAAVSTWAENNNKMFYTEFANTTFTTDFSSKNRTVLGYKENTDRLDAAIVGYASSRIPGSFTFKFKNLAGMTADAITPTELTAIQTKKMNSYFKKFEVQGLGNAQLDGGWVASGKFIDQIESRDWIKFRIEQEIATLLTSTAKIPYTNAGIQQIVTAISAALTDATANGIIATNDDGSAAYVVAYKTVSEIPTADRTARKVTGITFSYVEAGAIHETTVTGAVVLNL